MDNQSITHTRWNCTYHIVFIPKFRRKIMYGETKKDLVEIIKKLCEMKQVIIPGISEPPVRTLRATIPENERHIFR